VGGSYVVNAASPHADLAVEFLNSMATPEMGNKWLETVLVQTGIKSDPSKISGPHADYFQDLADASDGITYFFGLPSQVMRGGRKEVFDQVVNAAFPAGLVSVDEVIDRMSAAKE
jgi:multiple sugar transport system substrate-binding protein